MHKIHYEIQALVGIEFSSIFIANINTILLQIELA